MHLDGLKTHAGSPRRCCPGRGWLLKQVVAPRTWQTPCCFCMPACIHGHRLDAARIANDWMTTCVLGRGRRDAEMVCRLIIVTHHHPGQAPCMDLCLPEEGCIAPPGGTSCRLPTVTCSARFLPTLGLPLQHGQPNYQPLLAQAHTMPDVRTRLALDRI